MIDDVLDGFLASRLNVSVFDHSEYSDLDLLSAIVIDQNELTMSWL
jgi:hypothetical protein